MTISKGDWCDIGPCSYDATSERGVFRYCERHRDSPQGTGWIPLDVGLKLWVEVRTPEPPNRKSSSLVERIDKDGRPYRINMWIPMARRPQRKGATTLSLDDPRNAMAQVAAEEGLIRVVVRALREGTV